MRFLLDFINCVLCVYMKKLEGCMGEFRWVVKGMLIEGLQSRELLFQDLEKIMERDLEDFIRFLL